MLVIIGLAFAALLKPGDRFKFFFQPDGTVAILPKIRISRLKGSVPKLNRPISVKKMNVAIEAGATKHHRAAP
jgi:antitoxin PrlF